MFAYSLSAREKSHDKSTRSTRIPLPAFTASKSEEKRRIDGMHSNGKSTFKMFRTGAPDDVVTTHLANSAEE
jgi:hypothetical protein